MPHASDASNPARRHDVAIVGGGIVGSSTAYFVKTLFPGAQVCVVEPDPTYALASTLRASGGVRVLFSCPENIEMSKFSRDFIKSFPATMAVGGREAPVDWVSGGYLFIVPPKHMDLLESNFEAQRRHGCEVELLSPQALKASEMAEQMKAWRQLMNEVVRSAQPGKAGKAKAKAKAKQ